MNCNRIISDKNCNIIIQEDNYDNDYAFVYILQLNHTKGTKSQVFIKTLENEQIIFNNCLDGFYTLVTLKVSKNPNLAFHYNNDKFYNFNNEIELLKLIELNPNVTGIDINYEYYFQSCILKKCFIDICYLIFDTSTKCDNYNIDKNLTYKRDLIWSALNVIKYMTEQDQYEEAERLLERIVGCNGLCSNSCLDNNILNCGCK